MGDISVRWIWLQYLLSISFVDKREEFLILLLGFVWVLELENIDIQGLLMLAHFAQHNRPCFVKFWVCQRRISVSQCNLELLEKGSYRRSKAA